MMTPDLRDQIQRWSTLWGVPGLAERVEVRSSRRLRSALARCRPSEARITLSDRLAEASPRERAEVLCHELAHVAVMDLYGSEARPHGEEWRALVRVAGFEPRVKRPGGDARQVPTSPPTTRYAHRCPVCQTVRYARRPVARWRCAACVAAGLKGRLEITSEPAS